MRKYLLQLFSLLCMLAVQGKSAQEVHPEVTLQPYKPWEVIGFTYTAFKKIYDQPGGGYRLERSPGQAINVQESYEAMSGGHIHNGSPRDGGHWISAKRQITDANGVAFFDYRPNGFSGTIKFRLTPENQGYPIEQIKFGLWVRDYDHLGQEQLFISLSAASYTMFHERHLDTRHGDTINTPANSRYGMRDSVHMIQDLAYEYHKNSPLGLLLDILPSGMPDGGVLDARMSAAPNSGYIDAEWRAPVGAYMMHGVEWRVANPKFQAGSQFGQKEYDIFEEWVYKTGCKTSYADDNGDFLINKDGHTGHWQAADSIIVICSAPIWVAH